MKKKNKSGYPSSDEIMAEIERVDSAKGSRRVFHRLLLVLVTMIAATILLSLLFFPMLTIYGTSMTPTFMDGDIVLAVRTKELERGDIVAFRYNNNVLVKRLIASSGDWVMVDNDGKVYINDRLIDEPYVDEPSLGDCNVDLPLQVPDTRYFVMGDHRSVSLDSRNTSVGFVTTEQIVGRLVFRIWPITDFGFIH